MIATMRKRCSSCKQEKDTSEFHKRGQRFQSECKLCRSDRHQATYSDRKERQQELNKALKARLRAKLDELKAVPCLDCKRSFPPYVMDFDHRPGELKVANVSSLLMANSWSAVEAEMAKCDIVCANCHRIRTHERYGDGSDGKMRGCNPRVAGSLPASPSIVLPVDLVFGPLSRNARFDSA